MKSIVIQDSDENTIIQSSDSNSTITIGGKRYIGGKEVEYDIKTESEEEIQELKLKIQKMQNKLSKLECKYDNM